ncbi:hypothetical protein L6R52_36360 [Myxococcota bacterium]|nr:hypothetical protein [Myxococcota bacterium]
MEHVHLMLVEKPKAGVVGGIEGALGTILANAKHAEVVEYAAQTGPKLDLLVQSTGDAIIETIDLVGHGSVGTLLVGGTASPGGFVAPNGTTHATYLDADVDKQLLLAKFFQVVRKIPKERRGADFRVRLLGCRVGLDEGLTDETSPVATRDGAVLIHHLASFLDVPVEAPVEYIFASDFESGHFEAGARVLRRCTVDPHTHAVEFVPAGFFSAPPPDLDAPPAPSPSPKMLPGAPAPTSGPLPSIVGPSDGGASVARDRARSPEQARVVAAERGAPEQRGPAPRPWRELVDPRAATRLRGRDGPVIDAAKVAAVLEAFPPRARVLPSAPLVAIEGVLDHGPTSVAIAAEGRDLIVEHDGLLQRVRGDRRAQTLALELLEAIGAGLSEPTRRRRLSDAE